MTDGGANGSATVLPKAPTATPKASAGANVSAKGGNGAAKNANAAAKSANAATAAKLANSGGKKTALVKNLLIGLIIRIGQKILCLPSTGFF